VKILVDIKEISKEEFLKIQEIIFDICKKEYLIVENQNQYEYLFRCATIKRAIDNQMEEYSKSQQKLFKDMINKHFKPKMSFMVIPKQ
jgi:hypothetical protein